MSLSATWDAEPKSHSFKMVFDSFTCYGQKQINTNNTVAVWSLFYKFKINSLHHTRILSGLMSAWRMLHRLSSLRAKKSCWLYERTALMCSPTSFPYFFNTSRKFILQETINKMRSEPSTNMYISSCLEPSFLLLYLRGSNTRHRCCLW